MNWPPAGANSPSSGASAVATPRASRDETTAIQSATSLPEPSVKIEISSAFDEIVKAEKAAQSKAAANPVAAAGSASVAGKPTDAGADGIQNTQSVNATTDKSKNQSPTETAEKVDAGKLPGPDQASKKDQAASKDWTAKAKAAEDKPPEPPKEPISKKLLDFLQNLWRAGGQAIDVADTANKVLNPPKAADGPLTYADPSVKKTTTS